MKHKSIQKSVFPPEGSIGVKNMFSYEKTSPSWDKFNRELYESIRYVKEIERLNALHS